MFYFRIVMGVGSDVLGYIKVLLITVWTYIAYTLIPLLWERFQLLLTAPLTIPDMLWIVTPLLLALLLMEFYFGRYSKEELGWNTAVGNSMILIFVALDLFRFLFGSLRESAIIYMLYRELKIIIALFVGLQGVVLLYENFFHRLPKRISFFISSALPINLTAYIAIVVIYTNIPIDLYTIAAAGMLFFLLQGLFGILHYAQKKRKEFIEEKEAQEEKNKPVSIHYNVKAKAPKGSTY